MAYQNGSATSLVDLMQKLAAFLVTDCGWTLNMSQADGAGPGWRLHASKNGTFINLKLANAAEVRTGMFAGPIWSTTTWNGIALYVGNGWDPAKDWCSQPGGPKLFNTENVIGAGCAFAGPGAITQYHFFADPSGEHIFVAVEKTVGNFVYLCWGPTINKIGNWTGGAYFSGTGVGYYFGNYYAYYNENAGRLYSAYPPFSCTSIAKDFIQVTVDNFTNQWAGISEDTNAGRSYTGLRAFSANRWDGVSLLPYYDFLPDRSTNSYSGESLLLPILLGVERTNGGCSCLGTMPFFFLTNACAKGFTPNGTYRWGSAEYVIFPGPVDNPHYGIAVRKFV